MFMKKWWLEKDLDDGRRIAGWINTTSKNRDDFPETIQGTFWTMKDGTGTYGEFTLKNEAQPEYPYIFISLYPPEIDYKNVDIHTMEGVHMILESSKPLDSWERMEFRIEDCLNLEKTYVYKY